MHFRDFFVRAQGLDALGKYGSYTEKENPTFNIVRRRGYEFEKKFGSSESRGKFLEARQRLVKYHVNR